MKTSKQKQNIYRQGDVLLTPIKNIPSGLSKLNKPLVTLALGEATGHHHSISAKGCVGYAPSENDTLATYITVKADGVSLTHQEHEAIQVPAGNYKVTRQTEYTPNELRSVAD